MKKIDKVQKLLSENKYEEILDVCKGEHDPIFYLYQIIANMGLARYDDALEVINKHHVILEEAFLPMLIDLHVAILREKKDIVGLMKAKEHYNELPYHSQVVEEKLRAFDDIIKATVASISNKDEKMSLSSVKRMIESTDLSQAFEGLKYLDSFEMKEIIDYVKGLLIDHTLIPVRASIVFYLGEKGFDELVKYKTYQNEIVEINPKYINERHSKLKTEKYILKALEYVQKDISLENIIRTIYTIYELIIIPQEVDENDETFFMALAYIAKTFMNINEEVPQVVKDLAEEIDNVTKLYL